MNTASSKIRTVVLVGHGAASKLTLAESLLAASGIISSRGSVERGNTLLDFDPLERNSAIRCRRRWRASSGAAPRFT